MRGKSNSETASLTEISVSGIPGPEDEKVVKIVDEVDRFFKSVHAEIEDWKFSMEDCGDGTRIFVRFQIHINTPDDAADLPPKGTAPARRAAVGPPGRGSTADGDRGPRETHAEGKTAPETAEAGPPEADPDLDSFMELWRHKQEMRVQNEFHKDGAPYVEPPPKKPDGSRTRGDAPST